MNGETDIALALSTLRTVCADDNASPSARQSASRTLLEYYGFLGTGRTQVPDLSGKSHAEMTLSDLQRRAAELRDTAPEADPFTP